MNNVTIRIYPLSSDAYEVTIPVPEDWSGSTTMEEQYVSQWLKNNLKLNDATDWGWVE